MKPSELLIEAAQSIFTEEENHGCLAIIMCNNTDPYSSDLTEKAKEYFCNTFELNASGEIHSWVNPRFYNREHRVMALLFAAAMAESDEENM